MNNGIPEPVAEKLCGLCVDSRMPAYILVDNQARVITSGGRCDRYGLDGLSAGEPVGERVDCLESLLPLNGEQFTLALVQVQPEVYADLHFFPDDAGDWVLLLDATPQAMRIYDMQQNMNELSLLRREQTNMIAQVRRLNGDMLSILNQLQVVTAVIAADGRIEFLSESGDRLLGLRSAAVCGRPWEQMLPFAEADKAHVRDQLGLAPGQRSRQTVNVGRRDGRRFTLDLDIRDDPRQPGQRLLYMYDVTEVADLRVILEARAHFHDMIGGSAGMEEVFRRIRDVAAVDATVLIEGDTGTGKELVARAIHDASDRRDKPFVVVNAAGLSDSLINSQLFGHKKGAFTDAVSDQPGFFEAATGGTIFLDEIGDIPMNTQTRILRALEQKEIMRIGETQARRIDVRILAATNKSLAREVERGNFREDLLYRLRVARIQLPPLRKRREDIPLLVNAFLQQSRAATGKAIDHIDQDAMQLVMEYAWPGNVRELKNAIAFACIHGRGNVIHCGDFPPELHAAPAGGHRPPDVSTGERDRILRALDAAAGSRGEAARMLGIGRATLYRRMKACGIDPANLPRAARWGGEEA